MRPGVLFRRGGFTLAFSLGELSLGVTLSSLQLDGYRVKFATFRIPFLYLSYNWIVKP